MENMKMNKYIMYVYIHVWSPVTDLRVVLESCHQVPGLKFHWEIADLYHVAVHCQTKHNRTQFQWLYTVKQNATELGFSG